MCQVEGTFARFDTHQFNMSEATGNQTTVCIVFDDQITARIKFSLIFQLNPVKIMSDFKQVSSDFAKASAEYTKLKDSELSKRSSLLREKEDLYGEANAQLSKLK